MTQNNTSKKPLGVWMLAALVAGNMIGSGIFMLPAGLAQFGSISLLSWIFTSVGAILLALVFAKLGTIMPRIGGPYAYCREAYGDFIGFAMAYNYWIALWVGNAAIAVAFSGYLGGVFFPLLKTNHWLAFLFSAGAVWVMTLINIIGIRTAGIMQLITTVLKLMPLLLIASLGLLFIHPAYLTDFNVSGHSHLSAFSTAATMTLWAFVGFESASVPAESVDNPQRNIPLATIIGTVITALIYILSTIAIMGVIPSATLAHSNAPYADAARIMFGNVGYWLIGAGAVISCLGALNGWTLLTGQVPLAASRDGLFPELFSKQTKTNTPINGLLISAVLITILLALTLSDSLVKQFNNIILLATLASLIPYFFTAIAELIIFQKDKALVKGKRLLGSSIIAVLGAIYAFWAIMGSGEDTVFYGTLLLFTSAPVYWLMTFSKKAAVDSNSKIAEPVKKKLSSDVLV